MLPWSDDVASSSLSSSQVGDDVAPTSLNEGRGDVVPALVVVLHLKHGVVGGWGCGGAVVRFLDERAGGKRAAQMWKCTQCGKAGKCAI